MVSESGRDPGDEIILKMAVDENLVLITADKDFGELVFIFHRPHSTIIRLVDIPAKEQGKYLLRLITTHQGDIEKRAIITIERFRVRVKLEAEQEL